MKTNDKLRRPIGLSITAEESEQVTKLNNKGITTVAIFRLGLTRAVKREVDSMTQNNIS